MNCLIIFQTALMDKMYDNQEYDKRVLKIEAIWLLNAD